MPFDQKRINGPDTSFSYKQFIVDDDIRDGKEEFGKRADGRNWDEHRKFGNCFFIKVKV